MNIEITMRADSGFSGPTFYKLADFLNLEYTIGKSCNKVLKREVLCVLHRKFLVSMFLREFSSNNLSVLSIKPKHAVNLKNATRK